jgi:cytochrome oxidase Cu insertion factor (SCO1/SenC/PrrC family)
MCKRIQQLVGHYDVRQPLPRATRCTTATRCALQPLVLMFALLGAPAALAGALGLADLPAAWVDDHGQPFELRTLQGHAVVLTMAYATCHRVCPVTIKRLQQLQRDYDQRETSAEFVVIGYDPQNDDAIAWRQYRERQRLTRVNWHFLIGTPAAVERTAHLLGFEFWKMDQHVIHDSRILFFDAHGTLVGIDEASELQRTQR